MRYCGSKHLFFSRLQRALILFILAALMFAFCAEASAERVMTFPDGLTEIEEEAFYGNSSIEKVVIPDGATSIGSKAFANCRSLWCAVIPDSVTYIAPDAFEGSSLVSIRASADSYACTYAVNGGLPLRSSEYRYSGSAGTQVSYTLVDGVLTLYGSGALDQYSSASGYPWFHVRDLIEEVVVGEGITLIGPNAFSGSSNLAIVRLPDSLLFIGRNAFNSVSSELVAYGSSGSYAQEWAEEEGVPFRCSLQLVDYPEIVRFFDQEAVSVQVEVLGDGLTYFWEQRPRGETKWYPAAATEAWDIECMDYDMDGWSCRCTVTDAYGNSIVTGPIYFSLRKNAAILTDPVSIRAQEGDVVTFTVEAEGDGITYEWQKRSYEYFTSDVWHALGAEHSNTLTVPVYLSNPCYRCVVTDEYGETDASYPATITLAISMTNPKDKTVTVGETATFAVGVSGDDLTLQWQMLYPGQEYWRPVSESFGGKTQAISFTAYPVYDGCQYRCMATDGDGYVEYTEPATLTVQVPVTGVEVSDTYLSMDVQSVRTLTASVLPANASNHRVTWSSSNPEIVSVSEHGVITTGTTEGTATIVVSTEDGGYSDSCTVSVANRLSMTDIAWSAFQAECGESMEFSFGMTGGVWPYDLTAELYRLEGSAEPVETFLFSGNQSSFSQEYPFDQPGTYYVAVTISDAANKTITRNSPYLYVVRHVESISLSDDSIVLHKGASHTLEASILPEDASNQSVIWSTSNREIAVCEDGVVTGLSAGTAVITAESSDGGFTASCVVTVDVPVTGVTLSPDAIELTKGESYDLQVGFLPSDATDRSIAAWQSSDPAVVSVSDGRITALSKGTAQITVTSGDGGFTASCTVTVRVPASGIVLDRKELSVQVGRFADLRAYVLPDNASDASVTWSSSDKSVATVSKGTVKGVSAGTAVITAVATDGGYEASCTVTVYDGLSIDEITLRKSSVVVYEEEAGFDFVISGGLKPYRVEAVVCRDDGTDVIASSTMSNITNDTCGMDVCFDRKGYFQLRLKVTDAAGNTAEKNSDVVSVLAGLKITSITTTTSSVDVGSTFGFIVEATGGRPPYNMEFEVIKSGTVVDGCKWLDVNKTHYEWDASPASESGVYYLRATLTDSSGSVYTAYSSNVTVNKVISTSIVPEVSECTLIVNESRHLDVLIYPANVTDNSVNMWSTNTSVVTWNPYSQIMTAIGPGTAQIMFVASDGDSSASVNVTVHDAVVIPDPVEPDDSDDTELIDPSTLTISQKGMEFIMNFEGGCHTTAYDDGTGVWTIGYGHTEGVYEGMTITEEQALQFFYQDVQKKAAVVDNFLRSRDISVSQQQYDAMVSLVFNLKSNPLAQSCRLVTLLEEYSNNMGGVPSDRVWECFATWHHVTLNGKKIDWKGLLNRRLCEARIFAFGDYTRKDDWATPGWFTNQGIGSEVPDGWVPEEYADPDVIPDTNLEDFKYSDGLLKLSPGSYALCYANTTDRIDTFTTSAMTMQGTEDYGPGNNYIDGATDELWLMGVGVTNGQHWAYVSYPTSTSRRCAYIPLSYIVNGKLNGVEVSDSQYYVYDRMGSELSKEHYVDVGDTVYTLAKNSQYQQILYPVSNGNYRIAWRTTEEPEPDTDSYNAFLNQLTSDRYAYCYAYTDGSVNVYKNDSLSIRGNVENGEYNAYIDSNADEVYILDVGTTGTKHWAYVSYPVGSSRRTGYVYLSDLIPGVLNQSTTATMYYQISDRRGWAKNASHYVEPGDKVYLLSKVDGLCQILYPVSNGKYRVGWCTQDEYNNIYVEPEIDENLIYSFASTAADSLSAFGASTYSFYYSDLQNSVERQSALNAVLQQYNYTRDSLKSIDRLIVFVDGYGSNVSSKTSKRSALGVVLHKGKVIFASTKCSTLPDWPFSSDGNGGTDVGTLLDGVYTAKNHMHRGEYPALNVRDAYAVRLHVVGKVSHDNRTDHCPYALGEYSEKAMSHSGINIHRTSLTQNGSASSLPGSAGCINIYEKESNPGDYSMFAAAAGFSPISSEKNGVPIANTTVASGKLASCSVTVIISRKYAYENNSAFAAYMDAKYTDSNGTTHRSAINAILNGTKDYALK